MEKEHIEGEDQFEPQPGLPFLFSPAALANRGFMKVAAEAYEELQNTPVLIGPSREILEHFDFANILDTIKSLREEIKSITAAYDERTDVMLGLYGELDRLRLDNSRLRDELIRMRDIVGPLGVPDTTKEKPHNPFRDFSGVDRRRIGG
jgi:hypothetical protein